MLLSKDRQNLLKIYSYDFIMVGMQVKTNLEEKEEKKKVSGGQRPWISKGKRLDK